MKFLETLQERARQHPRRLVFPEATEPRVLRAAAYLSEQKLALPVLIGEAHEIAAAALHSGVSLQKLEIVMPRQYPETQAWAAQHHAEFQHKGLTFEQAHAKLHEPVYFAAAHVKYGKAAGSVAGSVYSTSEVLRAALQFIGTAPGISLVSSTFEMVHPQTGRVLTFADCAVVPDPLPQQLAEIAVTAADTHQKLTGETPAVAMLSFATNGSAAHVRVEKVRAATQIARRLRPDLKIEGELQADAALVPEIAQRKAPASAIKGDANVLIFPDLDAGNIAYKLVQRLAGYQAVGPVLQGLAKPANDLSRGCSVEDIVNVACICAIMAGDK